MVVPQHAHLGTVDEFNIARRPAALDGLCKRRDAYFTDRIAAQFHSPQTSVVEQQFAQDCAVCVADVVTG